MSTVQFSPRVFSEAEIAELRALGIPDDVMHEFKVNLNRDTAARLCACVARDRARKMKAEEDEDDG